MALENQSPGVLSSLGAARASLERKDLPGALALYEVLLTGEGDNADVLAAISGDLGATGNVVPMIQLVAPLYDPERHGPAAGLNLLQAYLAVGDPEAARHVLDTLFALNLPELEERLYGFSNAISKLIKTGDTPGLPAVAPAQPAAAKGTAVSISKPIWFYGLEPLAAQILPAKGGSLRRVAFTQLALPGTYPDLADAMKRPEDEPARLSRALPAWLAETFYFSPHYAPLAALAVLTEPDGAKRPVLLDAEWTIENMRQLVLTTTDGLDYVFTGILDGRDGVYHLKVRLWEVKKFRERRQFNARWTPATADAELARLRDEICRFMEWRPFPAGAGMEYAPPEAPFAWIDALGASLGLFLAAKQVWPKELLAPLTPSLEALAPLAASDPIAALAWLTLRARATEVGVDFEAGEVPLVDHPIVAQARDLLG
jgi:hypothetical protein